MGGDSQKENKKQLPGGRRVNAGVCCTDGECSQHQCISKKIVQVLTTPKMYHCGRRWMCPLAWLWSLFGNIYTYQVTSHTLTRHTAFHANKTKKPQCRWLQALSSESALPCHLKGRQTSGQTQEPSIFMFFLPQRTCEICNNPEGFVADSMFLYNLPHSPPQQPPARPLGILAAGVQLNMW